MGKKFFLALSAIALFASSAAASEAVVVYSFKGGSDGAEPQAGLIEVGGALYGTTFLGGTACGYEDGCGTVFQITTAGVEKVLHSFGNGSDGTFPRAPLIDVGGTLYGTTQYGGSTVCGESEANHCGTVFKITVAGEETVLHSFKGGKDGATPVAGLIAIGNTLYGTTVSGGTGTDDPCIHVPAGCGTLFSITTRHRRRCEALHSAGGMRRFHPIENTSYLDYCRTAPRAVTRARRCNIRDGLMLLSGFNRSRLTSSVSISRVTKSIAAILIALTCRAGPGPRFARGGCRRRCPTGQ